MPGPDRLQHEPRLAIARLRWRHLHLVEEVRALHLATSGRAGPIRWVSYWGHNVPDEIRQDWIDIADIRRPGQPFIDDPWSFSSLWPATIRTLKQSERPGPALP